MDAFEEPGAEANPAGVQAVLKECPLEND